MFLLESLACNLSYVLFLCVSYRIIVPLTLHLETSINRAWLTHSCSAVVEALSEERYSGESFSMEFVTTNPVYLIRHSSPPHSKYTVLTTIPYR